MLVFRPVSLHGSRAFIRSTLSQRSMPNHAGGLYAWGLPYSFQHLAIQIDPLLPFFRTLPKIDSKKRYALHAKARIHAQEFSGTDAEKQCKRREQKGKSNLNRQESRRQRMASAANRSLRPGAQHLFCIESRQVERRQSSRKNHSEYCKSAGCCENCGLGTQIEEHGKVRLFNIADEQRAHPLRQNDPRACSRD